ncbi:hypothetical protein ASPVEDRAFT_176077 [Aspergillus versicolor CBS 583.65]|uniref:Uncharacterized protein n=1 Tax=Aspergillus versicolor CBS 583.65 TaxID=1036611 RepID=A0A1L9PY54_ASPVE|nr:uncharacterized protein ASPVEDRAFT_176077 [Aspergillus versicolor CBS 583.65]OJJ06366.1 hypothetical protein ASPVEDRAFT_176077 [Aspergillus versicolor CBS 583.65]
MTRSHTRHVSVRGSILMLLAIMTTNTSANHGLNLHHKRADTCSESSQKCSGAGLPDSFCCSSSSTCIGIDGGSSVICCPEGQDCSYIQPITCDVTKQNASLHPNNVIKTTRLDDDLPKCGKACCPFGYTCQGNFCAVDNTASSSTSTSTTKSTSTPTSTSSESTSESSTDHSTESSTATDAETTTDSAIPIAGDLSSITAVDSSSIAEPTPNASQYSAASCNNVSETENSCPAFPTNAVLAGFFPGSVFGAVAALILTVCIRRQRRNKLPPGEKLHKSAFRKSTGTLIGISEPIPSDDSSFRTDFLLSRNSKRNSEGSRSVLQRSRSRVKSLFSASPKPTPAPAEDIPAVPPVPAVLPLPVTPRQAPRQPSTESIRVYTPPGVFNTTGALHPSPYPDQQRPNTTLTEILDRAQAQMQASESAPASTANSKASSTAANNANQRFLLPPPQQLGRRKQLPY